MKPSPLNDLAQLARGINAREATLLALEKKTLDDCAAWLREAILQGADLNAARARCKHGDWLDWLAAHCPAIHYVKANRYMHLAANLSRVINLTGAESLRQALALCDIPVDGGKQSSVISDQSQQWLPYIDGISKFSKAIKFVIAHPVDAWPAEGREELREQLQPIAEQLWPEKFA